jgi:purine nucleosidase
MSEPRKVILDTDIGTDVDDALALTLGALSPEIDLVGVTTCCGDTMLRAKIARKLLRLLKRDDIPVAAGISLPLLRHPRQTMNGHEGEGILADKEEVPGISARHAVELMRDLVLGSSEPVTIVLIGAMTNLAAAIIMYPEIIGRIQELVIMGGAVRSVIMGGTQLPSHVETNLNNDPEAADIVLRAGIPTKMVPAEITFNAFLHKRSIERIRAKGTPLTDVLAKMCDIFHKLIAPGLVTWGVPADYIADMHVLLHDPLTLSALINPKFLLFKPVKVNLLHAQDSKVYTVCDFAGEHQIEVAVNADYDGFEAFLVECILNA